MPNVAKITPGFSHIKQKLNQRPISSNSADVSSYYFVINLFKNGHNVEKYRHDYGKMKGLSVKT